MTFKDVTLKIKAKNCLLKSVMDQIICEYHTHYNRSTRMDAWHFINIMTTSVGERPDIATTTVKPPTTPEDTPADLNCAALMEEIIRSIQADNLDHFPRMREMFREIHRRFNENHTVIPIKLLQSNATPGAGYEVQNEQIEKSFEELLAYLEHVHDLKEEIKSL